MKNFSYAVSTDFLRELFVLEQKSEYQTGINLIREVWTDFDRLPDNLDLENSLLSELLLRTGAIIGFYGSLKQIRNAQEQSKNLLTQARERFLSEFNIEKVAECENYLSLAYWRLSSYSEAISWLETSLSHPIPKTSYIRLYSFIIKSLITSSQKKYDEVIETLIPVENNFAINGDPVMSGWFLMNLGLAFKNTNENRKAFSYLSKAKIALKEGQNQTYLANVENNLAQVFRINRDFNKAHESIDTALSILNNSTKDKRWKAVFLDTKSLIYYDQKKYSEALDTVEKSIELVMIGEDYNFLTEISLTKIKILSALGNSEAALFTYGQMFKVLATFSDECSVQIFTKEACLILSTIDRKAVPFSTYKEYFDDAKIEFILPNEAIFQKKSAAKIFAVQVQTSTLEYLGIQPEMIILADMEPANSIKNGDLVAGLEHGKDSAFIGFYDESFGIICIDRPKLEPLIFSKSELEKLGKILGYGFLEKASNKEFVKISTLNLVP
jgi:tetratricopeptide (TPR) repeat protein